MAVDIPVAVDVQVACIEGGMPPAREISSWVERAVAGSGRAPGRGAEVGVRVVDADEMRALNDAYRRRDEPTNVLAFPAGRIEGLPEDQPVSLGDVVVCAAVVRAEAAEQGKSLADHWGHMLVHGTLHLMGFDHGGDAEAAAMEQLEARILAQHGVADPYARRP